MTLTPIIMFNIVLDIVAIALMSAIMSLALRLTPHDEADAELAGTTGSPRLPYMRRAVAHRSCVRG